MTEPETASVHVPGTDDPGREAEADLVHETDLTDLEETAAGPPVSVEGEADGSALHLPLVTLDGGRHERDRAAAGHCDRGRRRTFGIDPVVASLLAATVLVGATMIALWPASPTVHGGMAGSIPAPLPTTVPTPSYSTSLSSIHASPHRTRSAAPAPARPSTTAPARPPSAMPAAPTPTPRATHPRTPSSPAAPATGEPGVLRPGDTGPAVSDLQRALFNQGFTYIHVTGVYDAATTQGVRQFQQYDDVTGDPAGVYGPHTRAKLQHS